MFTSKDLKKLIIPLIFEQLLAVSVGFVDTFMVSIAGEAAVYIYYEHIVIFTDGYLSHRQSRYHQFHIWQD